MSLGEGSTTERVTIDRGGVSIEIDIENGDGDESDVTVTSGARVWHLRVDEADGLAELEETNSPEERPPWMEGVLRRVGIEGVRV